VPSSIARAHVRPSVRPPPQPSDNRNNGRPVSRRFAWPRARAMLFKGNSSRLQSLIEKIQSNQKDNHDEHDVEGI